ncbi:MAG: hypothetical protein ACK5KP_05790 [Paludibacteraceae bacterium]
MAELVSVGKTIHPETKTIDCIANMKTTPDKPFINEGYVQAKVIISNDNYQSLPNSAFIKSEGSVNVYLLKERNGGNFVFEKKEVHITKSNEDFSAVTDTLPNIEVLVNGGSTL